MVNKFFFICFAVMSGRWTMVVDSVVGFERGIALLVMSTTSVRGVIDPGSDKSFTILYSGLVLCVGGVLDDVGLVATGILQTGRAVSCSGWLVEGLARVSVLILRGEREGWLRLPTVILLASGAMVVYLLVRESVVVVLSLHGGMLVDVCVVVRVLLSVAGGVWLSEVLVRSMVISACLGGGIGIAKFEGMGSCGMMATVCRALVAGAQKVGGGAGRVVICCRLLWIDRGRVPELIGLSSARDLGPRVSRLSGLVDASSGVGRFLLLGVTGVSLLRLSIRAL